MRYFIVFYKAKYPSKSYDPSVYIFEDILVKSKVFPNKNTTQEEITEMYGVHEVHITGIKEVTKEESEHYYK